MSKENNEMGVLISTVKNIGDVLLQFISSVNDELPDIIKKIRGIDSTFIRDTIALSEKYEFEFEFRTPRGKVPIKIKVKDLIAAADFNSKEEDKDSGKIFLKARNNMGYMNPDERKSLEDFCRSSDQELIEMLNAYNNPAQPHPGRNAFEKDADELIKLVKNDIFSGLVDHLKRKIAICSDKIKNPHSSSDEKNEWENEIKKLTAVISDVIIKKYYFDLIEGFGPFPEAVFQGLMPMVMGFIKTVEPALISICKKYELKEIYNGQIEAIESINREIEEKVNKFYERYPVKTEEKRNKQGELFKERFYDKYSESPTNHDIANMPSDLSGTLLAFRRLLAGLLVSQRDNLTVIKMGILENRIIKFINDILEWNKNIETKQGAQTLSYIDDKEIMSIQTALLKFVTYIDPITNIINEINQEEKSESHLLGSRGRSWSEGGAKDSQRRSKTRFEGFFTAKDRKELRRSDGSVDARRKPKEFRNENISLP